VAVGFGQHHISPTALRPVEGVPLILGHDGGLTPVTIIGQCAEGDVRILAALASERAGTRQHIEALVRPWLATHAPWALGRMEMLIHHYDPSMDTPDQGNLESNPVAVIRTMLGGYTEAGESSWTGRYHPLLTLLTLLNRRTGRPQLQLDPEGCRLLIAALYGRWYFPLHNGVLSRDLPKKNHPWSDLGDGLTYLVAAATPGPVSAAEIRVEADFDVRATRSAA
jgi:hypothetical protein